MVVYCSSIVGLIAVFLEVATLWKSAAVNDIWCGVGGFRWVARSRSRFTGNVLVEANVAVEVRRWV